MPIDLLGREFTVSENELLAVYERLKSLAAQDDLAPCVTANVRHALAYCAQAVTDLGLAYEHLLEIGV